ncbi:MAG: SIMPL domain-containing protein [Candidatus Latescibacteria bacterium]|nr:SIMPL domain-containing protein [Candidatus Latescibacterota bacterium]
MRVAELQLIAGGALLVALLNGCETGDTIISPADGGEDRIYVTGSATVKANPDIAQAQLGVQSFADSVDQAVADNNARSGAIQAALTAQGIGAKDLQTSGFNVYPQMDYEKNPTGVIVGYWATNVLSVKIRKLAEVGDILQAGIDAGANNVSGLYFALEDPDSLLQEARVQAVADARKRAEGLVGAAGGKLGKVLSIRETSPWYGPVMARADFGKAAGAEAVPVQPGELEVTGQVEVVFEIE